MAKITEVKVPVKTIPWEDRTLTPLKNGHGVVEEKEEEVNYVHNWLYSVVPIGIQQNIRSYSSDGISTERAEFPLAAYLTGFCRECRKAFSAPIPHNRDSYLETQMEVPVYGCVKPGTYR